MSKSKVKKICKIVRIAILLVGLILLVCINVYKCVLNVDKLLIHSKLESGDTFDSDCVVDEIDAVKFYDDLVSNMEYFYSQTGVQPYMVFKKYDGYTTITQQTRQSWIDKYMNSLSNGENSLVFVYFATEYGKRDGYICLDYGSNTESVMDDKSVDMLYKEIDKVWSDTFTLDRIYGRVFSVGADSIMQMKDYKPVIITNIVIVVTTFVLWLINIIVKCIYCAVLNKKKNKKHVTQNRDRRQTNGTSRTRH
jgi:hypothetical protein